MARASGKPSSRMPDGSFPIMPRGDGSNPGVVAWLGLHLLQRFSRDPLLRLALSSWPRCSRRRLLDRGGCVRGLHPFKPGRGDDRSQLLRGQGGRRHRNDCFRTGCDRRYGGCRCRRHFRLLLLPCCGRLRCFGRLHGGCRRRCRHRFACTCARSSRVDCSWRSSPFDARRCLGFRCGKRLLADRLPAQHLLAAALLVPGDICGLEEIAGTRRTGCFRR